MKQIFLKLLSANFNDRNKKNKVRFIRSYINSLKKKSLLAEEGWKDEAEFVSIPAANFQEALVIVQRLGLLQITFDIPIKSAKQLKFIFNSC